MLLSQIEFVVAGIFLISAILTLVAAGRIFTLWLQAFMAGVQISLYQLIGMRFRKVKLPVVIKSLIMATQAGVSVSPTEMERAYLQGVDLEKITLAMIHANREGLDVTFHDLVEADLEKRLHEKMGLPP